MSSSKLKDVNLGDIWWDNRYRDDLGDLSGLMESILEKGVIQPITVCPVLSEDGEFHYKLLAGERRVTACCRLLERPDVKLPKTIPAVVRDVEDSADEREIELFENVFRKDFAWDEKVKLVNEIDRLNKAKNSNWSIRKTAQYLGCSPMEVSRQTTLAKALEIMPELADMAKNESDALKIIKKYEEQHVNTILKERQQERMSKADFDFIKIAEANYMKGDCFKGLASLRTTGVVHLIECDPPYGINLTEMKKVEGPTSTVDSYQEIPISEYQEFMEDLCTELFRVAGKDSWLIMWYGPSNHQLVRDCCTKAGWTVGEIPALWVKPSGQTMQPSTNLANCYEPFFVCRKGQPVLVKQGRANVFHYPPVHGMHKYHPTERPVSMMIELLETFCPINGVVLVPCLGSGVTLRACYLTGRKGFGWDLNGEYKDKFLLAVEQDLKKLEGESDNEE